MSLILLEGGLELDKAVDFKDEALIPLSPKYSTPFLHKEIPYRDCDRTY